MSQTQRSLVLDTVPVPPHQISVTRLAFLAQKQKIAPEKAAPANAAATSDASLLAEICRPRRRQHADVRRRSDHDFSAWITAAISVASARRAIFTTTPSISSSTAAAAFPRRRASLTLTCAGAGSGPGSRTAGTNA